MTLLIATLLFVGSVALMVRADYTRVAERGGSRVAVDERCGVCHAAPVPENGCNLGGCPYV